jgi:hypothetical protein
MTRAGRPGSSHQLPGTQPNTQQNADSTTNGIPSVFATRYPPSGRRTQVLLVVRNCAYCTPGDHAHRGQPGIRDAGCGAGQYRVVAP